MVDLILFFRFEDDTEKSKTVPRYSPSVVQEKTSWEVDAFIVTHPYGAEKELAEKTQKVVKTFNTTLAATSNEVQLQLVIGMEKPTKLKDQSYERQTKSYISALGGLRCLMKMDVQPCIQNKVKQT